MQEHRVRDERLQTMLSRQRSWLLWTIFAFKKRMPSRAAAVRELLRRGLAAEGFALALAGTKSTDYGVIGDAQSDASSPMRRSQRSADHHYAR